MSPSPLALLAISLFQAQASIVGTALIVSVFVLVAVVVAPPVRKAKSLNGNLFFLAAITKGVLDQTVVTSTITTTTSTTTTTTTKMKSIAPPNNPLTIRNLTTTPLTIVSTTPVPSPRAPSILSTLALCFLPRRPLNQDTIDASLDAKPAESNGPGPSDALLQHDENADSLIIAPFSSAALDITLPPHGGLEIILLSRERRYTTTLHRRQPIVFTTDTPSDTPLEGIFLPNAPCLAILAHAPTTHWMAALADSIPLSALSIPGTHNSPTCHVALPSVRCQAVGVRAQLDNGVRFLDVRVSTDRHTSSPSSLPSSSSLTSAHPLHLVHGAFSVSFLSTRVLSDLLVEIYAFLDLHPSETIILSLKREGLGRGSDADLHRRLRDVYCPSRPERWHTAPHIPSLGEARGRIVLLRRFVLDEDALTNIVADPATAITTSPPPETTTTTDVNAAKALLGWGASADAWPDNVPDGLVGGGHIRIQDYYGIMERASIPRKIEACRRALGVAAGQRHLGTCSHSTHTGVGASAGVVTKDVVPPPMVINFLSGSNFFNPTCWPERIAAKVNPAILEHLCMRHAHPEEDQGDGATGVVVTDWVGVNGDWDLIRCVIGMNARLLLA